MKEKKAKPLTLDGLVKYNQEVLFPYLDGTFSTKEEIKGFMARKEFIEFKDKFLTGQDEILGKLNRLLDEKTVGDEQEKRAKRVLEIHNEALKDKKILTEPQILEINDLGAF